VTKKALLSMLVIAVAAAMIGMGTFAYFVDTETSNDNTVTAGILELTIDGANVNVVKFAVPKMVPGNQLIKTWTLKNTGNVAGYLDISSLVVTSAENGRWEAEIEAGDTSDDLGELAGILGFRLFIDQNGDGWFGAGDVDITNAYFAAAAGNYNLDLAMAPDAEVKISTQINWWPTATDSQAMSDTVELDMIFELGQTPGQ